MRRAAKRDDAEPEVVAALEEGSVVVAKVNDTGLPDLLCFNAGRVHLLEVKTGRGKLTPAQERFHERWPGRVPIVRSGAEALEAVLEMSTPRSPRHVICPRCDENPAGTTHLCEPTPRWLERWT